MCGMSARECAREGTKDVLVDIVVYDGLDEMDALGPLEVLRSAGKLGAALSARLVTRRPQPVVHGLLRAAVRPR